METPQPPHVSLSGHIVIHGQLPPVSNASPDSVPPQPPPPWWKFWQRWKDFHKVTAYATLLLATGTVVLAVLGLIQIRDFREQARVQSRAYVFPVETQIAPLPANKWFLGPLWENSGRTPARAMFVYGACAVDVFSVDGHDFNYNDMNKNTSAHPNVLGPNQNTTGTGCFYTSDQIATFQQTGKVIYVGAEVYYNDIFNQPHLTRVCLTISVLGDPKIPNPKIEHT
jgi:hypothetical protein